MLSVKKSGNKLIVAGVAAFIVLVVAIGLFMRSESGRHGSVPKGTGDSAASERAREKGKGDARTNLAAADVPQNESSGFLRLFGRVTSEKDGTPVAGAKLEFFGDDRTNFTLPREKTTTTADGRYEFQIAREQLPVREGVLGVKADGYAAQITKVYSGRGQGLKPIEQDFVLGKGGSVAGMVVNQGGRPVGGVLVGRYQDISKTLLRADNPNQVYPSGESKPDGSFEIVGLPDGATLSLIATKRGYIPSLTENVAVGKTDVKVVIREGEASIQGFVYDTDGKPAPDIPVKSIFMRKGARPDFFYPRNPPNTNELYTYTDKEGYFEFPALLSGWQGVIAGYGAPVSRSVGDAVLLEPKDVKKVNLKFRPPIEMKGIVVQKSTGNPIAGVRVANQPEKREVAFFQTKGGGVGRQEAVSDGSGHFLVKLDRTVESDLFRMPPEISYALPTTMTGEQEKWERYRVARGGFDETAEVRIEVEQLTPLDGIVYMPDGKTPAANAEVGVQTRGGGRFRPEPAALDEAVKTDVAGKFQVKLPVGTNQTLIARHEVGRTEMEVTVPAEGFKEPVTLTLRAYGSIAGKVTDPDGTGMATVNVTILQRNEGGGFANTTVQTDANGTYSSREIMAGNVRVSVDEKPDYVRPGVQEFELAEAEDKVGVDFQYKRGVSFEGYVVDSEKQPIQGAIVNEGRRWGGFGGPGGGGPGGRRDHAAETDEKGYFKFDAIEPEGDTIQLEVTHPSYDSQTVRDLLPEDSPVTITMKDRGRIEFTVYAGDKQVTDFQYTLTPTRGTGGGPGGGGRGGFGGQNRRVVERTVVAQTDPVKEPLTPGNYDLNVYALDETGVKNGQYGYEPFELTATDGVLELKVQLGDALTLKGIVVGLEDKPISQATVELSRGGPGGGGRGGGRGGPGGIPGFPGGGTQSTTTDSGGNFSFGNITVGRVRLTARAPGLVQAEDVAVDVTIEKDPEPVTIRMIEGASVFGVVIDVDGSPMKDADIRLSSVEQGQRTDNEGAYRFDKLAPGNYDVTLRSTDTGAVIYRERTSVAASEQKEVNIDFTGFVSVVGQVTRNGQPENDPGTRITLEVSGEKGKTSSLTLTRDGSFETRMLPGTYNVNIQSGGGRVKTDTGLQVIIAVEPLKQQVDIPLRLQALDVLIVEPDEAKSISGKFVYTHKNAEGRSNSTSWDVSQKSFTISNQPLGQGRGVLTTPDGRKYRSEWTKITESSEKILTLMPDDVARGN